MKCKKRSLDKIRGRASLLNIQADYRHWTEEEHNILTRYYPVEGRIAFDRLTHKSYNSCCNEVMRLGLTKRTTRYFWTPEEDEILKQNYPNLGPKKCKELLSNRSVNSIAGRAKYLKLVFTYESTWTESELYILKTEYFNSGRKCFEKILTHTYNACATKVTELGLIFNKDVVRKRPVRVDWTQEEDELLIKYYPTQGKKAFSLIPRHSLGSCDARVDKLHLSCLKAGVIWTPEEDEILIKYYPIEGGKIITRFDNKTIESIQNRAFKLKIKAKNTRSLKIQCIETQEIFDSISAASRKYKGDVGTAVRGTCASAGKLPDGTKLHWRYVDEED